MVQPLSIREHDGCLSDSQGLPFLNSLVFLMETMLYLNDPLF